MNTECPQDTLDRLMARLAASAIGVASNGGSFLPLPTLRGLVALAVGTGLLAVVALAVPLMLRIRGRAALVTAALITASAEIVIVLSALSVLRALTAPGILLAELLLAAAAVVAWNAVGRPIPRGPWRLPGLSTILGCVRAHRAVATAAALACAALAVQFVQALVIAPNSLDSMTYHLSRIAYWLQYDSALHFPGGTVRQLLSPPNGELLQAWTMALAGVDLFAQLVQWSILIGIGLLVFLGARLLDLSRPAALFAASLYVVLPQPILQSSSTHNDLIVAFFVAATAVFGVRGIRDRSRGDLVIGGMAAGLAFGTKGTALLAVPALGLLVCAALWAFRPPPRLVAFGAGCAAVGALAFASFGYGQNFVNEGTLFGSISRITDRESPLPANTLRVAWHVVDLPGIQLGPLKTAPQRPLEAVFGDMRVPPCPTCQGFRASRWFAFRVDTEVNEDSTGLGPVGLLLFAPLVIAVLLIRRVPRPRRLLALTAVVSLVTYAYVLEWGPWNPRHANPLIVLAAPLLGLLALRSRLAWVAVGVSLVGLVPSLLKQVESSVLSANPSQKALGLGRVEQQAKARPDVVNVVNFLNRRVPDGTPIGLVGGEETLDYPLFGARLEQPVIRYGTSQEVTRERAEKDGLAGVLFSDVGPPPRGLPARKVPYSSAWWVPTASRGRPAPARRSSLRNLPE